MDFLGIVLLLYHLCRSSVGADPVKVQMQQWEVVGTQQVEEQVPLNGVSFTSQDQEFNTDNKNKLSETLLPDADSHRLELLIPILTFIVFSLLSIVSFLLYKWRGWHHPGGIIGSIVHYRRNTTGTD